MRDNMRLLEFLTVIQATVVCGFHVRTDTLAQSRQVPVNYRIPPRLVFFRRRVPPRHPPNVLSRLPNRNVPAAQLSLRAVDPFQANYDLAVASSRVRQSWAPPLAVGRDQVNSLSLNNLVLRPNEFVASPIQQSPPGLLAGELNNMQTRTSADSVQMATAQDSTRNSLLQLLEERKSVTRDERDLILIKQYLTSLNQMRQQDWINVDQRLEAQIAYIENITDASIQREVLKIFVKDLVEKSGFLDQRAAQVQDIESLRALIETIGTITNKFKRNIDKLGTVQPASNELTSKIETTTALVIPENSSQSSKTDLRSRLVNSLTNYERDVHMSKSSVRSDPLPSDLASKGFQGRSVAQPAAGLSIFGEELTARQDATTSSALSTDVKRVDVVSEPLGGNDAYWTHLRAGLADMLCNLCRQRQNTSCIKRYCENSMVRKETQTPTTPVAIAPIV